MHDDLKFYSIVLGVPWFLPQLIDKQSEWRNMWETRMYFLIFNSLIPFLKENY